MRIRRWLFPVAVLVAWTAPLAFTAALTLAWGKPSPPRRAHVLYVDIASIGGPCHDQLPAAAVSVRTPWCSLTRAMAAAPPGSTVYVRAGDYPRLLVPAFAPSRMIRFIAYPHERPVVAGIELSGPRPSHNFAFDGFKITGSGVYLANVRNAELIGNEIALRPVRPTDCRPSTCTVHTPTAITLTPPASDVVIRRNYIHDGALGVLMRLGQPPRAPGRPAADTAQRITIANNLFARMGEVVLGLHNFERVVVSHNVFADDMARSDVDPYCHCDSVHATGGGDRLLLDGNVVYGGRGFLLQPGDLRGNCDPRCLELTHTTIENNVLVGDQFGLRVISSPGIRIVNNTIWGTQVGRDLGLTLYGPPPVTRGAVVANNIIRYLEVWSGVRLATEDYNDVLIRARGPAFTTRRGRHDIRARPRFVNPGRRRRNFELRRASPCIRAGSSAFAPSLDITGRRRAHPPSLGAFEYRGPRHPRRSPHRHGAPNGRFGSQLIATLIGSLAWWP